MFTPIPNSSRLQTGGDRRNLRTARDGHPLATDSADLRGHTVRWEKTSAPAGDRRCRESSRLALAARAAAEVRSTWLPIWPNNRAEMNELALANRRLAPVEGLVRDSAS